MGDFLRNVSRNGSIFRHLLVIRNGRKTFKERVLSLMDTFGPLSGPLLDRFLPKTPVKHPGGSEIGSESGAKGVTF